MGWLLGILATPPIIGIAVAFKYASKLSQNATKLDEITIQTSLTFCFGFLALLCGKCILCYESASGARIDKEENAKYTEDVKENLQKSIDCKIGKPRKVEEKLDAAESCSNPRMEASL